MHDGLGGLEYLKLAIFYASYLYFLAAPLCLWLLASRRGVQRAVAAIFLGLLSCLAYARFVEPRILIAAEHDIELKACGEKAGVARIAVISDLHTGLFGNAMPVQRIVRRIKRLSPDFTLIAGDFVYFLDPERYDTIFSPFRDMDAPVFAVLGNHDIGLPGPDVGAALTKTLPRLGVDVIDNQSLRLSSSEFDIDLVGLSDQWGHGQNLSLLEGRPSRPRIVLTHNPATASDIRLGMTADLLIGGHTHGGQIQLPVLTCMLTGVCGDIAYGLREENGVLVFTTSGTGMVGLPMRFRVPPRVDILNIGYEACATVEDS